MNYDFAANDYFSNKMKQLRQFQRLLLHLRYGRQLNMGHIRVTTFELDGANWPEAEIDKDTLMCERKIDASKWYLLNKKRMKNPVDGTKYLRYNRFRMSWKTAIVITFYVSILMFDVVRCVVCIDSFIRKMRSSIKTTHREAASAWSCLFYVLLTVDVHLRK